jgi:hypothetical protein
MKKKKSFQSGRIWLNVFEADNGQEIVTINKSIIHNGEWKSSPFFNVNNGDITDIKQAIEKYEETIEEVVVQ